MSRAGAKRRGRRTPRFTDVYRDHHGYVWQSLRCLGVVDSALDDAVQDVFVVVYRRLGEFEHRASLRTWLFEIVRRVAWRYRTRAHRDAARTFELPELASNEDLDHAVERALAVEILRAFVDRLDQDKLNVFMLAEFGELPGREIADALGVNMSTVYARLRSARDELDRLATRLRAREAGSLLAAARHARPSPTARRRTWGLLAANLGLATEATATAAVGWTAPVKWLGAAAVLTAIVGIGVAASDDSAEPTKSDSPQARHAAREAPPEDPRGNAGVARQPNHAVAAQPADEPAALGEPAPSLEPPARAEAPPPTVAPQARPVITPALHVPASTDPSPQAAALAAEVALVTSIRDAVAKQDGAGARALLRQHRDRYPQGALRPEVDALAAELRCATATSRAEANAQRRTFERRWPGSSLIARVARACGPKKG